MQPTRRATGHTETNEAIVDPPALSMLKPADLHVSAAPVEQSAGLIADRTVFRRAALTRAGVK